MIQHHLKSAGAITGIACSVAELNDYAVAEILIINVPGISEIQIVMKGRDLVARRVRTGQLFMFVITCSGANRSEAV